MKNNGGWAGKIAWVDLNTRKTTTVPTSDFEPEKYLGGVGLNSRIFWELGCPEVEAFHPDNPLIISSGPLTGVSGPFGRATACTIAPHSYPDELFTHSGFGGKFPSELKFAGYDGIVILGKSEKPVYLLLQEEKISILDGSELWGLDTYETQGLLNGKHPGASSLSIGPAGENLSRISIIINETSGAAAQGGYGAVMGSKNLKAIVANGSGTLKIAKPDDFSNLIQKMVGLGDWVASPNIAWGRYPNLSVQSRTVQMEMRERYLKKFSGCYACPYQCHGIYDIPDIGRGAQMCADTWYGSCTSYSTKGVWKGGLLSQRLGINNFELAGLLNFVRTSINKGMLTKEDFGFTHMPSLEKGSESGYDFDSEHYRFLEELLNPIADGTGIFAQGVVRASRELGDEASELCDEIFPAWGSMRHHIRGIGEALHWATDTRDPLASSQDYVREYGRNGFGNNSEIADWFGVPGGYLEGERTGNHTSIYDGIETETIWVQNHQSLKNSLHICELASPPGQYFHPPEMDIRIFESSFLSAVTGLDVDVDELWKIGERIYNMRRTVMVMREDRHRDQDALSPVWYERAFDRSLAKPLDRAKFEAVKDAYYKARGWDSETGRPTVSTLNGLGMGDIGDRLKKAGKIL